MLDSNFVKLNFPEHSNLIYINHEHIGKKVTLTVDFSNHINRGILYQVLVKNYQNIQDPPNFQNNNRPFLSFDWRGISTGEMAMLRLFSRLNRIREVIIHRRDVQSPGYSQGQIKNLIFLI